MCASGNNENAWNIYPNIWPEGVFDFATSVGTTLLLQKLKFTMQVIYDNGRICANITQLLI